MDTEKIKISILGLPEITYRGQPFEIARRQVRNLLFYLAACDGWVTRSDISEKFVDWEKTTDTVANRRVRELISKLKNSLPVPDALMTINDQVGLNPDYVEVDARIFRRLYQQQIAPWLKKQVSMKNIPETILPSLSAAVKLWHGKQVLQGMDMSGTLQLEDWFTDFRSSFDDMHETVLSCSGSHAQAIGDLEGAIYYYRLALDITPFGKEELSCQMLTALKQIGRFREALERVNILVKHYEEDGEPMPDALEKLCNQIQGQFSTSRVDESGIWNNVFVSGIPFVGRESELEILKESCQRTGMAVIEGEIGMGKSRLVYEFYQNQVPPPRLVLAACSQLDQGLPYQPLIQMIDHFMTEAEWEALDERSLSVLSQFLPDVTLDSGRGFKTEIHSSSPSAIYESIYQALVLMSRDHPLLMLVDNIQWADESSLETLNNLVKRKFFNNQQTLILTFQPDEATPSFQILRDKTFTNLLLGETLKLTTLNETHVAQMLQQIINEPPSRQLCTRLVQESGGNPLILAEALRWYQENYPGRDLESVLNEIKLPATVNQLLRAQMKNLEPRSRQILNAASVVGPQFSYDLVAAALDTKPDEVVDVLEDLEWKRLVRRLAKKEFSRGYTFVNNRLQSILYNDLSEPRKQLYHQRIAFYMEQHGGIQVMQPTRLAEHFEAAGEFVKAFEYWFLAIFRAVQTFSNAELLLASGQAAKLVSRHPALFSEEQVSRLLSLFADAGAQRGELEELGRFSRFMMDLGKKRKSHLLIGVGLGYYADWLIEISSADNVEKVLARSIKHLEACPQVHELLRAYNRQGTWYLKQQRLMESRGAFERVIEMVEQIEAGGGVLTDLIINQRAIAQEVLARIMFFQASPQSILLAEKAVDGLEYCFDYQHLSRALITLATIKLEMGEPIEAFQIVRQAQSIINTGSYHNLTVINSILTAQIYFSLGQMDECWQTLRIANQLCQPGRDDHLLLRVYALRWKIFLQLEDYEKILSDADRVLELQGDFYYMTQIRYFLSAAYLFLEDFKMCNLHLDGVLKMAKQQGLRGLALRGETIRAIRTGRLGNWEQASLQLEQIAMQSSSHMINVFLVELYRNYAELSFRLGRLDVSRRLVEYVIKMGQQSNSPWLKLQGLPLLHQLNQIQGKDDLFPILESRRILSEVEQNTTLEPFKSSFNRFKQNYIFY